MRYHKTLRILGDDSLDFLSEEIHSVYLHTFSEELFYLSSKNDTFAIWEPGGPVFVKGKGGELSDI